MLLYLVWEPKYYPAYMYIQQLPVKRVHLYTFAQLICLAILYGLKADQGDLRGVPILHGFPGDYPQGLEVHVYC